MNDELSGRLLTLETRQTRSKTLQDAIADAITENADGMEVATVVGVLELMKQWIAAAPEDEGDEE